MWWRCSGSICSVWLWTCATACSGSDSGGENNAGAPAAESGGDNAQDPDAGSSYRADAGEERDDAGAQSGAGGAGGGGGGGESNASGRGGSTAAGQGGSADGGAADSGVVLDLSGVEPAECRPDPTDFTACGGDLTGQWRVASICFEADIEDLRRRLMCPKVEQDFSYQYRMLVAFEASGSYTAAVDAEAVHTATLPLSCLPKDADCTALLGENDTDDSDGSTLLITMSETACTVEARERETRPAEGTWQITGGELTMTDSTGPDTSEYCVSGDALIVRNVNEATNEVSWGVFERFELNR